jgi:hypothetical protein
MVAALQSHRKDLEIAKEQWVPCSGQGP